MMDHTKERVPMLKNNKVVMALSLVFAIAIWMYVIGVVDPSTTRTFANEKVKVTNEYEVEENGLVVENRDELEVTFRVKAPRTVMTSIKNGNYSIYVNVKKMKKGTQEADIKIKLPSGARLTSIAPETAVLKLIDREAAKKVQEDRK